MPHLSGPADDLVAGATLVNATGLGKDRPVSPVTDCVPLGPATVAWDVNYRGDLIFLRRAAVRRSSIMDGWDYSWPGGPAH